jgi:GTP cyclohydrolase II
MTANSVTRIASARIPTEHGEFQLGYYSNTFDDKAHLALSMGESVCGEDVLVRVHSECLTGDVFGSLRCDCGEQLDRSLQLIAEEGRGVLVYLRQEGRGIGLLQKIHAYNLQDAGHDTVEANLLLGHRADERDYSLAARILEDFAINSIRLITNNPAKIHALEVEGVQVTGRVELECEVNPENFRYLMTKAERMNHLLSLNNASDLVPDDDSHESQSAD